VSERLSPQERLDVIAELCPRHGARRPCDSRELALARAGEILATAGEPDWNADYLLMRAVDRYAAGEISLSDLYRLRVLAYYMTFARGGEEWARWGVAAAVRPGDFPDLLPEPDLADLAAPAPPGPPWRDPDPQE
jgi:hypothetical protein